MINWRLDIVLKIYHENSCKLAGCESIRRYIYGGKGIVTLLSPSGEHHTYMFKKPLNEDVFPNDILFVYAVHEQSKLFYIGMIEQGKFRLTRASRFLNDTPIVRGVRYIMRMMTEPNLVTPMELYHEGMCSVCGRPLTNPKSIKIGVGPKCRGNR